MVGHMTTDQWSLRQSLDPTGDQLLHDFIGATVDSLDSAITISSSDRELPHVSPAPMELDTFINNLSLEISQPISARGGQKNEMTERGRSHLAIEAVAVSSFFSFNNSMQRSTKVRPMQISVLRVLVTPREGSRETGDLLHFS
jgi:hypothetical protein